MTTISSKTNTSSEDQDFSRCAPRKLSCVAVINRKENSATHNYNISNKNLS